MLKRSHISDRWANLGDQMNDDTFWQLATPICFFLGFWSFPIQISQF